jgi:tetratricopeptide (TPR) repeat protein
MTTETAKYYIEEGAKCVKNGNFTGAINSYKKAIELAPMFPNSYFELGSLLVKLGEAKEGIAVLQQVAAKLPKNPASYVFLGAALFKQGETELAQSMFKTAIQVDPTQPLWVYYQVSMPAYDIIELPQLKLAYCPMPKCASSTIKSVFYKVETGETTINPHPHYNNPFFKTQQKTIQEYYEYFKFVVIRDPVKRFLSYYSKNILDSKSLESHYGGKSFAFGLDCVPDINFFVDHLEDYIYTFIDVRHHTLCQHAYLGDSLDAYDFVCRLEEFDKLVAKLNQVTGQALEFPQLMKSKESISNLFPALSLRSLEKLIDYYAKDYEVLSEYYSPNKILRSYKEWILNQSSLSGVG